MVIQSCSEVFAILMQMEVHASFSSDAVSTLLNRSADLSAYPIQDFDDVVANDRTSLPHLKS